MSKLLPGDRCRSPYYGLHQRFRNQGELQFTWIWLHADWRLHIYQRWSFHHRNPAWLPSLRHAYRVWRGYNVVGRFI